MWIAQLPVSHLRIPKLRFGLDRILPRCNRILLVGFSILCQDWDEQTHKSPNIDKSTPNWDFQFWDLQTPATACPVLQRRRKRHRDDDKPEPMERRGSDGQHTRRILWRLTGDKSNAFWRGFLGMFSDLDQLISHWPSIIAGILYQNKPK